MIPMLVTREAIERGGVQADAHMAERLYHRGLGYQHEAVKIFMPAGAAALVYAPYTEHYPPDTQAASLWLRNLFTTPPSGSPSPA